MSTNVSYCLLQLPSPNVININTGMSMQLVVDPYKWLVVMKCMPNDGKQTDKDKVQLSSTSSSQLQNGSVMGKLIKSILRSQNQSSPSSLDHLKEDSSAAAKTANWNVIWSCLPLLRMDFDPQIKDLILSGDNEMISEVVKQLQEKYPADISKVEVQQAIKAVEKKAVDQKAKQNKQDVVDMTKLDKNKDPDSADSSLEFLLLVLCQSLHLPANEVLGLFTNQNKYLAHLIAKGLKGDFTPIIKFYEDLKDHVPKMKSLFENDSKSEAFTLYALKPGLVSKSPEVVQLTIDLFKEFEIYEWFIGESKCLLTLLLGVKRHPDLNYSYVDLLVKITEDNFADFITNIYKTQFETPEQQLIITGLLLKPLSQSEVSEKLDKSGVVFEWLAAAMQNIEADDPKSLPLRLASLQFITKLWVAMPEYIEDDEETYNRLLLSMKKDWTTKSTEQFVSINVEMIGLLVALATEKNPAAKLIYNMVAVVLSQVINLDDRREFLLHNFTQICKQFPNIPLGYLLQNYNNILEMQIFDFQFLTNIANSPNLDVKSATIIGQIASKFFQQSVVNGCCSALIVKVVSRFPKDLVDFAGKTVKVLLATLYATEKNKKTTIDKPMPVYNGRKAVPSSTKQPTNQELETQIISAQKRSLIIELIKKIIIQNNQQVNEKIKPYIIATSLQIKQFNKQGNKGINALLSLYGNQKQLQQQHLQQSRQRRASQSSRYANDQSLMKSTRPRINIKVTAPDYVLKDLQALHESVVEKQKKQERQSEIKQLEEEKKKILVKKEMEKVKFMKGFGGEGQLFEEGYWDKRLEKKADGIEVVELDLLEPRDLEFIDIILKKYHKVMRQLFLKYTTTGFTTRNSLNFDQQAQRTETISNTELVKLLKQYKLFFLTDLTENQQLVRDVNVKILKKRQTQQFDFSGFEQYIVQFALVIFSRPHTVNIKTEGKVVSEKRQLKNMMPAQILESFFKYLRTVTDQKGENTVLFDDPDTAYFNESEVIKEFNQKLEEDPNYILPEGYKKVTDKSMTFQAKIKGRISQGIKESYIDCSEILDEILFNSLGFHTLELISSKTTKSKARPNVFVNIASKLMDRTQKPVAVASTERSSIENANRLRDMIASAGDAKPHYPVEKLLEKKTLSVGMKIGLSRVPYKYKLLGEQVAFVIDDMISAVEAGRTTIQKPKILNEVAKHKQKLQQEEKKNEQLRKKKLQQRKKELEQIKKELIQKKQKDPKIEEQKTKKKKEEEKQKKRKQEMDKYLTQQKAKLDAKKKEEEQLVKKQLQQDKQKKKKQEEDKKKKFDDFNQKQIDKFKGELKTKAESQQQKKKKQQQQKKIKQEKLKKLRSKIHGDDQKINKAKHKINEQLNELYSSPAIQECFKKHDYVLKSLYDFLIKSTFVSVGGRQHNNEIIFETWTFFNFAFRLSPIILQPKETAFIFQSLTRLKHQTKEFYLGLDYEEFKQALLRESVKHKSVFSKISLKIKDEKLQNADISEVLKAEDKNEFEEPKQMDIGSLLKQEVTNPKILDDYGDISKADENTLRGLIYYLKLPEDKHLLEKRFRQVLEQRNKRSKTNKQELKSKLNEDYSVLTKSPKPKAKRSKSTIDKGGNKEEKKQQKQPEQTNQELAAQS